MHICGSGYLPDTVGNLLCNRVIALHVGTGYLDIDGCRQSEVQNLGNDIRGLKEKLYTRELMRQFGPKSAHIPSSRVMMLLIESHQYLGVTRANYTRIAI